MFLGNGNDVLKSRQAQVGHGAGHILLVTHAEEDVQTLIRGGQPIDGVQ